MIHSEDEAREYVAQRCDQAAFARLERFVEHLVRENAHQNLVSRGTLGAMWQRHIADSAQLLDYVEEPSEPWLDLGTGAGLPGVVIAAMRSEWTVVLVESRRRRIEWLNTIVAKLELRNCRVEGQRLERVEAFPAGVISARAFAPLLKLLDLSARFSTSRTQWVLPKGKGAAQELAELPRRFGRMFHVEQSQTSPDAGIIVGTLKMRKS